MKKKHIKWLLNTVFVFFILFSFYIKSEAFSDKYAELKDYLKSEISNFEDISYSYADKAYIKKINVYDYKIPKDDWKLIFDFKQYDPSFFYLSNSAGCSISGSYVYEYYINYLHNGQDAAKKVEEYNKAFNLALEYVSTASTDIEKIIKAHDYIIFNTEYYTDYLKTPRKESATAYGVFVEKKAVCDGYSLAFSAIMKHFGIECKIIMSEEMNHSWNAVFYNGKYYNIDLTWDDPITDKKGYVRYDYFMKSNEYLSSNEIGEKYDVDNSLNTGTDFDDFFWNNSISAVVNDGDFYYYIKDGNKSFSIYKVSSDFTRQTRILNIDKAAYKAYVPSKAVYFKLSPSLSFYNGRLYYSDYQYIYSVNTKGLDMRKEKKVALKSNTYIQHFYIDLNSKIMFNIFTTANGKFEKLGAYYLQLK